MAASISSTAFTGCLVLPPPPNQETLKERMNETYLSKNLVYKHTVTHYGEGFYWRQRGRQKRAESSELS